jgi:hypothetical protein
MTLNRHTHCIARPPRRGRAHDRPYDLAAAFLFDLRPRSDSAIRASQLLMAHLLWVAGIDYQGGS